MPEDVLKQIIALLQSAKSVALILPVEPTVDSVCAASALHAMIQKMGGSAIVVSAAKTIPQLPFLRNQPAKQTTFGSNDQLAVKISNAHAQPGELRYEMESDGLVVYLKSKEGTFLPEDVSVLPSAVKFDALVVLGASSFDQLGDVYTSNSQVFFDTTIINIDINPANEYFGTINMVNVKVSSISESVLDLVDLVPDGFTNDTVTTGLLAGIIEQTHSFRDPKTTPSTLSKAAQLVIAGARQQDIIQYLYKTKPFTTLQLWGRALARLVSVPESALLYTAITKSDLEKTESGPEVLIEVLRDLVEMVSDFSIIALAAELPEGVKLFIAAMPHVKAGELLQRMGAPASSVHHLVGNYEFASAVIPEKTMAEIQALLLQSIRA